MIVRLVYIDIFVSIVKIFDDFLKWRFETLSHD